MKTISMFGIIIIIILIIWIIGTILVVYNIEEPSYTVIENKKGYEIRQYNNYIVAEVEVSGSKNQALSNGFRILAGYIFGGNIKNESISMTAPVNEINKNSEKIAMTIPVSSSIEENNTIIVQFSMPSKYTLENLPIPNNDEIKIKEIKSYKAAVLNYSGYSYKNRVEKMKEKLKNYINKDNLEINGKIVSAQYNPPYSFPFLRRNEIIIPIK